MSENDLTAQKSNVVSLADEERAIPCADSRAPSDLGICTRNKGASEAGSKIKS